MYNNTELNAVKLSATKKDFYQIWNELLETATKISNRWDPTSTNESDPGIVLLKVLTAIADRLNYAIDVNTLEAFMPSAAQESSMRKLCEMMGTSMGYYKSATTEAQITFKGDWSTSNVNMITLPSFTNIKDIDNSVNYVTLGEITLSDTVLTDSITCMEGMLVACETDNDNVVSLWHLDDHQRYFLPEVWIAENGIFITNATSGDVTEENYWTQVQQLTNQELGFKCFKFGYDSTEGLPYVQFPADIAELIGDGLTIKYIRTQGLSGNIAANMLTELQKPAGWDGAQAVGDVYDPSKYIIKHGAAINGQNKESIDSAYMNFKKTIGTFDTLVTCRDYMNKIYTMLEYGTYGNPLVSNIIASDIRDDINRACTITTYSEHGIEYINQANKLPGQNGEDAISHFDIILYPFHRVFGLNTEDEFKNSFQLDTDVLAMEIAPNLEESGLKTISHTLKLGGSESQEEVVGIKNYLMLNAKISTYQKVGPVERLEIENKAKAALYAAFNMRYIEFGQEIPYDSILQTLENADPRIRLVVLDEPVLKTKLYLAKRNAKDARITTEELEIKLKNDGKYLDFDAYQSQDEDEGTRLPKALKSIIAGNVLAGRISLFAGYNNFESSYAEIKFPATIKIGESETKSSFFGKHINVKIDDDETGDETTLESPAITQIKAENSITFTNPENINYTLNANEIIQFRRPNLRTRFTIPGYVNYYLQLLNPTSYPAQPAEALALGDYLESLVKDLTEDDIGELYLNLPKDRIDISRDPYLVAASSPSYVTYTNKDQESFVEYFSGIDSQAKVLSLQTLSGSGATDINTLKKIQIVLTETETGLLGVTAIYFEGNKIAENPSGFIPTDEAPTWEFSNNNSLKVDRTNKQLTLTYAGATYQCTYDTTKSDPAYVCFRKNNSNDFSSWNNWLKTKTDIYYTSTGSCLYVPINAGQTIGYLVDSAGTQYAKAATASVARQSPLTSFYVLTESGSNAGIITIVANSMYELRTGEYLYLNYTTSKAQEDGTEIKYVVNRILGAGTIIKPNFDLMDSGGNAANGISFNKTAGFNFNNVAIEGNDNNPPSSLPTGLYTLAASEQIEVQEFATSEITDTLAYIYWIRNNPTVNENGNQNLFFPSAPVLEGNGNSLYSYILQEGEYLFYTDQSKNDIAYYGAGTQIIAYQQFQKSTTEAQITAEEVLTFGSAIDIPWAAYRFSPESPLIAKEYYYLTLQEGDTLKALCSEAVAADNGGQVLDANWVPCDAGITKYQLKTEGGATPIIETLPVFNLTGAQWEVRSKLLLNCGPEQAQILRATSIASGDDNYTSSKNSITFFSDVTKNEVTKICTLEPTAVSAENNNAFKTNLTLLGDSDSLDLTALVNDGTDYIRDNILQVKVFQLAKNSALYLPKTDDLNLLVTSTINEDGEKVNEFTVGSTTQKFPMELNVISPADDYVALIMIYVARSLKCKLVTNAENLGYFNQVSEEDTDADKRTNRINWAWAWPKGQHTVEGSKHSYSLDQSVNMHIIQVSGNTTDYLELYAESIDNAQGGSGTIVISKPLWVKQGELNPQVLPIDPAETDTIKKNAVADLLETIAELDYNNIFYYNTPIMDESALEFNALDKADHLLRAQAWYDTNNIQNKFVISELDPASVETYIEIARGSRR